MKTANELTQTFVWKASCSYLEIHHHLQPLTTYCYYIIMSPHLYVLLIKIKLQHLKISFLVSVYICLYFVLVKCFCILSSSILFNNNVSIESNGIRPVTSCDVAALVWSGLLKSENVCNKN